MICWKGQQNSSSITKSSNVCQCPRYTKRYVLYNLKKVEWMQPFDTLFRTIGIQCVQCIKKLFMHAVWHTICYFFTRRVSFSIITRVIPQCYYHDNALEKRQLPLIVLQRSQLQLIHAILIDILDNSNCLTVLKVESNICWAFNLYDISTTT